MHLFHFLVVITSLGCGSLPPAEIDVVLAVLATLGMVTAWVLLSHVAARTVAISVRGDKLDPQLGAEWLEKQLAAFRWIGLAVALLCLAGFGLARVLNDIPVLADSMFLQALVLLTPAVAITLGTWSAEHRYGVLLGYTPAGIGNHLHSVYQAFRGGMAWLVVPVLILLGLSDVVGMLPISESQAGWLTTATIVLFVPLGLPWLIRHLFKTRPLDAETEDWVRQLMAQSGLRRTRALCWDTGNQSLNAMVAGFVPPLRTLLLSDRLLDELPRPHIAMVVLHEAAHLRRRHVPMRMLAVLPAWIAGMLVTRLAGEQTWALTAGSVVGILATMLILRWVAYRTEHDADVQACRIAASLDGRVDQVPDSFEAAVETLAAALSHVTGDQPAARKATWLHPSVDQRVDWMRQHCERPRLRIALASSM